MKDVNEAKAMESNEHTSCSLPASFFAFLPCGAGVWRIIKESLAWLGAEAGLVETNTYIAYNQWVNHSDTPNNRQQRNTERAKPGSCHHLEIRVGRSEPGGQNGRKKRKQP